MLTFAHGSGNGLPTAALVAAIAGAVRNAGVLERVEFTGSHLVALVQLRSELPTARFGLFSPEHRPWMNDRTWIAGSTT